MRKHVKTVAAVACAGILAASMLGGCGGSDQKSGSNNQQTQATATDDQAAADNCAKLIDAIYVQERTDTTDADCEAAKAAWDALTDTQKAMVEGENADPDYFGLDTGDASKDDPLNADNIGDKEILVCSFGTSFNDSRVETIGAAEKAIQKAYPDWSVRRAFTAQIIINHIQARDGEKIDNVDQAIERAKANGVKELIVVPTHLMNGAEFDELKEQVEAAKGDINVKFSDALLGTYGKTATSVNKEKKIVAKAITAAACKDANYADAAAAAKDGTAFVFMGHGTGHKAAITYSQMQAQMNDLGYKNVFVGTVEGEPESTSLDAVLKAVKKAGYKNVIMRPLMVVAGDHANNDMAGDDDDSWVSTFKASGAFDSVTAQIQGLGALPEVQQIYIDHIKAVM
ncbi:MAG: sirohydrochlorin cobaltochelatase [Coriobacteriales bacterium]|nr:sirohydrochlorin cobaltochelatase [Coriobacteriales bacterium]